MASNVKAAGRRDLLVSVAFMALGGLAILKINWVAKSNVANTETLTAATLPTIYGALLILLSGILVFNSIRALRMQARTAARTDAASDTAPKGAAPGLVMLRTWGTLGLLVAYALLLKHVNFIALTAVFLACQFLVYGRRSLLKIAVVSVLGSVGFYILFIRFLNLPI